MSNESLARSIHAEFDLRSTIDDIAVQSAKHDLGINLNTLDIPKPPDWFRLLRLATIFTSSSNEAIYDDGLRLLYGCLIQSADENARALAAALLLKLPSNPSIDLAVRRGLLPAELTTKLPFGIRMDVLAHQLSSTISIGSKQEFIGSDFQSSLWRSLTENDWVSASAPTSAGKSFVLEKWIEHTVDSNDRSSTFFIVPTRALISQVESDLRSMFSSISESVNIVSLPMYFRDEKPHNIYIYTQERFHLYLLNSDDQRDANLVIIDEAQKIGADRRGILLQQVLELASKRYAKAKFLFASPSTENPESLLGFAPPGSKTGSIVGQKATVSQNLVWVQQVARKPKEWNLSLMLHGEANPLGSIQLDDKPTTTQKLPFIAHKVANGEGGNVIYVNRASDAEAVAEILCQFVGDDHAHDEELNALAEYCEKAVHPKFRLRRFVRKGIAFHYGNIPQLIRSEIERLFSAGKIKFLVCTSTLVEGVNLSCRNVFMRHPKRGSQELMSRDDFWNLAGRAGRWGREFQGNIFCIDPEHEEEWAHGVAPRRKDKHVIKIASQQLRSQFEAFVEFVETKATKGAPIEAKDRFFEQLLSYQHFRQTTFGDLGSEAFVRSLSAEQRQKLETIVQKTVDDFLLPIDIAQRNPGISPYAMNQLYRYFKEEAKGECERFVPADPLSDDAVDNYIGVFSRITKHLQSASLGRGSSAFGNALLVVNWMRGYPLARLIENQIRHSSKHERPPQISSVIRSTMEKVERIARFEAPKYLHCYIDILNHYLEEVGRNDLAADMREFWLYLEFGVSKRTQLSLMSLGLSRSSVTALSDFIKEENLDEQGCLRWLMDNQWDEFGLPRLVELEIGVVLANKA